MSNLSYQKRRRMLDFLNKLREEHRDDDETLIALGEIENELNTKKYGLVWEEHEEAADAKMQTHIPVFTEIADREIMAAAKIPAASVTSTKPSSGACNKTSNEAYYKTSNEACNKASNKVCHKASNEISNEAYNFLLEGDNLHSLRLLQKTHRGRIGVIYIDPPYNTGGRDFVYDDSFVDKNDGFRHSKWLSFMSERLRLAKTLLSERGVIFISIDDNELYPLKLLCDEVFGENCFVANLIWQKKTGASDARGIAVITEYILVYVKDSKNIDLIFDKNTEAFDRKRYRFSDEYVSERGQFYYDSLDRGSVRYSDSLNYGIEAPDGTMIYPNGRTSFVNDGWTWKWSREKVKWGIENGFIDISPSAKKENGWAVRYKIYLNVDNEGKKIEKAAPYKNVITSVLNANAAADVKKIFGGLTVFQYSKPVNLIKILLRFVKDKDCTVLDFFAGSGTTGQAVLEKNREDHSDRHFILCTNNENDICETITYARLKKVICGYTDKTGQTADGIPANLKYYKVSFIPRDSEEICEDLTRHIPEMIQLERGISLENPDYQLILDDEEADRLQEHWPEYPEMKALYVSRDVLFTAAQNALFQSADTFIIPDYYFDPELKEAGESW